MKKQKQADVVGTAEQQWFYSKKVKEHFFNPRNIFKNAEEAKGFKADGVGTVGSPACLVGDSRININYDTKRIDALNEGCNVLSHNGTYNKIGKIFSRSYSGELIRISNQFGDLKLTPEHLVLAIKKPDGHKFDYTPNKKKLYSAWFCAEHLGKRDIFLYPIPKETRAVTSIEIPQEKARFDFKSVALPKKIEITPDLLELFGYFISEGNTRRTEICFSFSINEMNLADRVREITKRVFNLEAVVKEQLKRNLIRVYIYNTFLSKWFRKTFGGLAEHKIIPDFLVFLSPKLQESLIRGLWLGDGYINLKRKNPRAGYSTISSVLVQQLKLLLLRQRIAVSVYEEKEKERKGVRHKKSYRLHVGDLGSLEKISRILGKEFDKSSINRRIASHSWFDEDYYYAPIKEIEKIPFTGKVFNLEVAASHSYVTDNLTVHNCGDVMKIWIKVDKKTDCIKECKWSTFGCASAIASTSMLSVMVTERGGMNLDAALKITPQDIIKRLGGLPERKIHCSVLGDKALRAAINDYFEKTRQSKRMVDEGTRVVDIDTGITNKDIEHAVLDGARSFEDVQKRTKIGIKNKKIIPEVKRLIAYYRKKHFGKKFE